SFSCTWTTQTLYADDGSGWMATVNTSGEINRVYRKDGTVAVGTLTNEDSNGNYLITNSQGYTDTLGRSLEAGPTYSYTDGSGQLHNVTHYYDSNATQQSIDITAVNVSVQTHLCPGYEPCQEVSG